MQAGEVRPASGLLPELLRADSHGGRQVSRHMLPPELLQDHLEEIQSHGVRRLDFGPRFLRTTGEIIYQMIFFLFSFKYFFTSKFKGATGEIIMSN